LPPGHPLENLLREAPDFRHEAALADALLHPQDRAYSVPQLFDFLERGGLTFGRWLKQAPYSPQCGVLAKIPQTRQLAQLPLSEQYAAVELFRGTMVTHSIIAYRNDAASATAPISFDRDAWLSYIPIRTPDTLTIQERLPPGAVAVLLNQTHTYRDLILPISSAEKRLLDGVDGNTTIRQILEKTAGPSKLEEARGFFERLWWYDQLVFQVEPR